MCSPCRKKEHHAVANLSAGKTARRGGMGDSECSLLMQTFCEQMCSWWMTHSDRGRLEGTLAAHLESPWEGQTSADESLLTAHGRIPYWVRLEVAKWDVGNQTPFQLEPQRGWWGDRPWPDGSFK